MYAGRQRIGRLAPLLVLALLTGAAGCGGSRQYPVRGKVVFEDGQPLDEGIVICEMQEGEKTFMARGGLRRDGTFQLGTQTPGDGARPGTYRVLVVPRYLSQAERKVRGRIIDPKFEKYETSGLLLEVKPGRNEFNITIVRPQETQR